MDPDQVSAIASVVTAAAAVVTAIATVLAAVGAGFAARTAWKALRADQQALRDKVDTRERALAASVSVAFEKGRCVVWNGSGSPIHNPLAVYYIGNVEISTSSPARRQIPPSLGEPFVMPMKTFVINARELGLSDKVNETRVELYFTDADGKRWKRRRDLVLEPATDGR